ncbi:hypothetical protein PLANTIT3_20054 [Plantibacter sp. T3]|nr:hypothetical protein PLANTIT3_20054 [Plantibacter sp. T3]
MVPHRGTAEVVVASFLLVGISVAYALVAGRLSQ